MSISLLLALLEAHGDTEADRSRDYYKFIEATWDGTRWAGGNPDKKELVLAELYTALQEAIGMAVPGSGALGTVLARTLTDDPRGGLPEAAARLRAALKQLLLARFDVLLAPYPSGKPAGVQTT